jgi:leucyl aminopeptidase (aminopeptidase T)
MSTEGFERLFFDVCTMDYSKMIPGANALKELMDRTDKVEIKGEGVDLRFSIRDIPAFWDACMRVLGRCLRSGIIPDDLFLI